jgi:hypothetical protein
VRLPDRRHERPYLGTHQAESGRVGRRRSFAIPDFSASTLPIPPLPGPPDPSPDTSPLRAPAIFDKGELQASPQALWERAGLALSSFARSYSGRAKDQPGAKPARLADVVMPLKHRPSSRMGLLACNPAQH